SGTDRSKRPSRLRNRRAARRGAHRGLGGLSLGRRTAPSASISSAVSKIAGQIVANDQTNPRPARKGLRGNPTYAQFSRRRLYASKMSQSGTDHTASVANRRG